MRLEKWKKLNEKDQDVFPEENVGLFTDETGDWTECRTGNWWDWIESRKK